MGIVQKEPEICGKFPRQSDSAVARGLNKCFAQLIRRPRIALLIFDTKKDGQKTGIAQTRHKPGPKK
jgi:hypothetical protein